MAAGDWVAFYAIDMGLELETDNPFPLSVSIGGGGASNLNFPASGSFTVGTPYYYMGSYAGSSYNLLALLQTTLNSHGSSGNNFNVTLNSSGYVTITHPSTFTCDFTAGGTETLLPKVFGWTSSTGALTGSNSYTSTNEAHGVWRPGRPVGGVDSVGWKPSQGEPALLMDGTPVFTVYEPDLLKQRELSFEYLAKSKIFQVSTGTGNANALDTAWNDSLRYGGPFYLYNDETNVGASTLEGKYALLSTEIPVSRSGAYKLLWDVRLPLVRLS